MSTFKSWRSFYVKMRDNTDFIDHLWRSVFDISPEWSVCINLWPKQNSFTTTRGGGSIKNFPGHAETCFQFFNYATVYITCFYNIIRTLCCNNMHVTHLLRHFIITILELFCYTINSPVNFLLITDFIW